MKSKLTMIALLMTFAAGSSVAQEQSLTLVLDQESESYQRRTAALYYASEDDLRTTGLGVRIHFDSSETEILNMQDGDAASGLGSQILPDTDDLDSDPLTDSYVNAAWADILGQWPRGDLPALLWRMSYLSAAEPGAERFSITQSAAPAGFGFSAHIQRETE